MARFAKHLKGHKKCHRGKHLGGARNDIKCDVLCNGKPAWFHGKWPCFGKLSLHCEGSHPDAIASDQASTAVQAEPIMSGAGQMSVVQPLRLAGSAADARRSTDDAPVGDFDIDFTAECKGIWTGFLGHRCMGFASEHAAFKDIDMYKFCSGKQGVSMKHRGGAFAKGSWCKGKALVAIQKSLEAATAALQAH